MKPHFLLLASLLATPAFAGDVVVTVKPLHSLVAGVTQNSGVEPVLLVSGATSVHDFSLKPSQASALRKADVVFYMGESFEQFMAKILPHLPASTQKVAMEKAPGMTLLPTRKGVDEHEEEKHGHEKHGHEGHGHGEEAHHHDHGAYDLHAWLSVANSRAMVKEIARDLAAAYPDKAASFETNAKALDAKLKELDAELKARMKKLHGKPFTVFHDAYQYFEHSYELSNVGAVTFHTGSAPNAGHLNELHERIRKLKVKCIFREPQFDAKVVDGLAKGSGAKTGTLDPEGSQLAPGPELYFDLMRGIATSLETCLQ